MSTTSPPRRVLIFMGVCGSGKSTLAIKVADYLGCGPIIEGDSFHSPEMKEKMRRGVPLTDEDRWPWLARLNQALRDSKQPWTILSCSALKRAYREKLAEGLGDTVRFIFLDAPKEIIAARLAARAHEYMPPSLLESQFETLERPYGDEPVVTVSVAESEEKALAMIRAFVEG
jgi:gluconokinase